MPLSEGRVEAAAAAKGKGKKDAKSLPKELQCAYHGFHFDGDGSCTAVPQALSAKEEQRAKASPRACAAVHPIKHCGDGLLWAWPVAGDFVRAGATPTGEHSLLDTAFPDAADAASSSSSSSAGDGGSVVFLSPWFVRDIPFDVDVSILFFFRSFCAFPRIAFPMVFPLSASQPRPSLQPPSTAGFG